MLIDELVPYSGIPLFRHGNCSFQLRIRSFAIGTIINAVHLIRCLRTGTHRLMCTNGMSVWTMAASRTLGRLWCANQFHINLQGELQVPMYRLLYYVCMFRSFHSFFAGERAARVKRVTFSPSSPSHPSCRHAKAISFAIRFQILAKAIFSICHSFVNHCVCCSASDAGIPAPQAVSAGSCARGAYRVPLYCMFAVDKYLDTLFG